MHFQRVHSIDKPIHFPSSCEFDDPPASWMRAQYGAEAIDIIREDEIVIGIDVEVFEGFYCPEASLGKLRIY